MNLSAFVELVTSQGFEVKPKAGDAGTFVATKAGYADTEFYELWGHVSIFWPGRYPVTISTQHW